ncbi:MAG TPA: hypothetical protein VGD49_14755, partial [Longimicrobiales bacterium]
MRQFAILLASMTFPTLALAQTQTIPLDLAKALLAGGASPWDETQWVEIVVGGPPRQWRIEPLKDMQLMGSASYPSSATVVYAVDGDIRAAESAATQQFQGAGWTVPATPERPPALESGFVPTNDVVSTRARRPLCKGDRGVMINGLDMPSGPRVLRVVY